MQEPEGRKQKVIIAVENTDKKFLRNCNEYELTFALKTAINKCIPDLIEFLIIHNADPSDTLVNAVNTNNTGVVSAVLPYTKNQVNEAISYASQDEIFNILLPDATDLNGALATAVSYSNTERVNRIIEINKDTRFCPLDFNKALYIAVINRGNEIIDYLVTLGANNFNLALYGATRNGNFYAMQKMIDYGATNVDLALFFAFVSGNHEKVIDFLIAHGAKKVSTVKLVKYNTYGVDYLHDTGEPIDPQLIVDYFTVCVKIKQF